MIRSLFLAVALSAAAHADVAPISPADDASNIGSSVTLQATVKGEARTVTFYGRVTTPAKPGPDFAVVAIPDTQFYSENTHRNGGASIEIFRAQTQWIVNNRATRNIAFVSHMGDIVQNGDKFEQEWINADGAMKIIENPLERAFGMPWGGAPGNHDSAPGEGGRVANFFNQYFGISRFNGRDYYGGHYGTTNNNNYQLFSASGLDFIAIHLEFHSGPRSSYQAVLDWANALLQANPNRRAIVTSHWIVNAGNPATFSKQGQAIYDALKGNPNLFLMLCGHVHGEGRRTDTFNGRTVYSVLQDYQDATKGGNGFLRVFTFSPAKNQITVESYSPTLNRAVDATDGVPAWSAAFTLPYDMQSAVTDWIPLGTVNLAAGETAASLHWKGLEAGKNYEWHAANDNLPPSGTRRFSTAGSISKQ